MVGVAIGFASTTAFPAVERLSENGKHKQCRCAGMRFAKLGQTKPSGPTGLGMRRPLLRKETRERKSYAIDRPLFLILFEAGQIENEMHKRNRGRVPCWAARPTDFEAYTSPITRPKKRLSVAPLESI